MRWLYRLGLVLGALFVLLVFAGLALPKEYRVERSVDTRASKEQVHALVAELEAWPLWAGAASGVQIIDEDPALGIAYEVRGDEGEILRRGAIRYEEPGEESEHGLLVTWLEAGDMGSSPLARYLGFARGREEGARLETGLARLARLAEDQPALP